MAQALSQPLAYFPGCSGHGTGLEYDLSTRRVCEALGVRLEELEDWNCCGASSAHALDAELSAALGERNLTLAEATGASQLVVPCAACYSRLKHAAVELEAEGAATVGTEVVHLLELLSEESLLERLAAKKFNELHRLKVAPYYGCLITRPPEVTGAEDAEDPTSMDRILRTMEIEVVSWPYKTRCCGTSLAMTRSDIVERLTAAIVEMAARAGAEAIVTACPLCFVNLDTRQRGSRPLPVFYFTELMALYLDVDGARAIPRRHQVSPVGLLRSKGVY